VLGFRCGSLDFFGRQRDILDRGRRVTLGHGSEQNEQARVAPPAEFINFLSIPSLLPSSRIAPRSRLDAERLAHPAFARRLPLGR
jgi:hypothetical protein